MTGLLSSHEPFARLDDFNNCLDPENLLVQKKRILMVNPRHITKYSNRRLYDRGASRYITLEDVYRLILAEVDFIVIDMNSPWSDNIREGKGRVARALPCSKSSPLRGGILLPYVYRELRF